MRPEGIIIYKIIKNIHITRKRTLAHMRESCNNSLIHLSNT